VYQVRGSRYEEIMNGRTEVLLCDVYTAKYMYFLFLSMSTTLS